MTKLHLITIERVFVIFFLFHILHAFYIGATTLPIEGDSLAYHIPIAENLWQGGLLHPLGILHYYPSIGEAILSIFLLLHLPLNLFNVVGTIVLFFTCRELGRMVSLKKELPTIFAVSICLLNITLRWVNTQVIDIWLAIFFVWSFLLFLKPLKTNKHYALLGTVVGLLIGTKNSGFGFAMILILLFLRKFSKHIDVKRFVYFIVPVSIFGLFWYVRNFYLVGNPLYPQSIFSLDGAPGWNILHWNVGKITLQYPMKLVDALVSEYMGWGVALVMPLFFLKHLNGTSSNIRKLTVLAFVNLFFFLILPTTPEYSIIVSSLRYAYPVIIPLILASFLIAQELKKEEHVVIFSLVNILFLSQYPYHPKLFFIFVPIVLLYLRLR